MLRMSAHQKNYGSSVHTQNYTVVVNNHLLNYCWETQQIKETEKDQMKKLNNRLVTYVSKVHDLEMANSMLTAENARLKKQIKTSESDVSQIYRDEVVKLRIKVEGLQDKNTRLEIKRDNQAFDLQETTAKLESERDHNEELEREVTRLRKDVDDATIERSNLETKVENLQEALQVAEQVHEAEMENLRNQIQPDGAPILTAEQPPILPDLNDAIATVRKQYEAFNTKSLEDLDNYYKEKVESSAKRLKAAQKEIEDLRVDNAEKRKIIYQLELELETLRGKNDALERSLENMNDRLAKETAQNEELIKQMHEELDHTKEDMGQYLKMYQNLNRLNISLQQEISIYQKVLSEEEARISERNTSINTTAKVASVGSRSRASSMSSSSSSSRDSSPERKTDQVVEEMQEMTQEKEPSKEQATVKEPYMV